MSKPSNAFSAEVRAYLARHKKTPSEIAHVLGVSEATIYRRLNEDSAWPLDDAIATLEWCNLPLTILRPAVSDRTVA